MKYSIYLILIIILALLAWYFFQTRTQVMPGNLAPEKGLMKEEVKESGEKQATEASIKEIIDGLENLAKEFDNKPPFTVERVWAENNNFYIEYKNQTGTFAQLLVVREGDILKGMGYFSPSESGWVLQAGEGDLVGANALLYERDKEGKWERRN